MRFASKFFVSMIAAAAFLSLSFGSANACSEGGMTVWVPSSQTVADNSHPLPPIAKPDSDG
ncbi:MAG: hypothetical protein ISR47_05700 [Rhodospirillales bacterium]|nr:hypothetical protein [Rhodospirillales bacterium]